MKKKICPECGSSEIILNAGGKTGKYECKNCGYVGVIIIEED
jgi:predicted RNA-binding Zn-ribbon protein involved in translation (DUF1610 family)